jgi:death on curing protein
VFPIEDFLLVAEAILGIDASVLAGMTRIPLAESALAAPHASFGDQDFYERPLERAAILASRIVRNHPLPDGNKRVALILMVLDLERHGHELRAAPDEIDRMFRALAARHVTEDHFTDWLDSHTEPVSPVPGSGDGA